MGHQEGGPEGVLGREETCEVREQCRVGMRSTVQESQERERNLIRWENSQGAGQGWEAEDSLPQVNAAEGMGNVSGSQIRFGELCPPGVFLASAIISFRLPCWLSGKESACQGRRLEFDPWVGKIPWRRKWQPPLVLLPGLWTSEPGGTQSMGSQELDMTSLLNHHRIISIRHKGQCRG